MSLIFQPQTVSTQTIEQGYAHRDKVFTKKRPDIYRVTFRSGNRTSGTESDATFNVNFQTDLDSNVAYMVNLQSFSLDADSPDVPGLANATLSVEMDSLLRNSFDTARGGATAGTLAVFKGYSYQSGNDLSGCVLPTPGFKNAMVNFRIRKIDGKQAVELDGACDWMLTLVISPAPEHQG